MKSKFMMLLFVAVVLAFTIICVSCGKNPVLTMLNSSGSGNFSVGIGKI